MDKWLYIAASVFFICMFSAIGLESYFKNQCRTEAIKNKVSVEEINRICR